MFKLAVFLIAAASHAETPKFEVASIKPCKSPEAGPDSSRDTLRLNCMPLAVLVTQAYVIFAGGENRSIRVASAVRVEGGPPWAQTEFYSVEAKAPGVLGLPVMSGPMLQALLEERFQLKVHRETREMPVFALSVAKGGHKLKPFNEDHCDPVRAAPIEGYTPCRISMESEGQKIVILNEGVTLDEFSNGPLNALSRPVVNRTGLSGRFDIRLRYTPDESTPGIFQLLQRQKARLQLPDDQEPGPTIFTALQDQLGLKLEATRGPREFLVIDHAERPSAN